MMSDLLVLGFKLLFLALLWLFVLFALGVIRTDLFGLRAAVAEASPAEEPAPTKRKRGKEPTPRVPTHITIVEGPQTGLVMPLGTMFLIGRTTDSTLVLDDQFMSTRHARIYAAPEGVIVEDLGSTNGTFVNEQRLTGPVIVSRGDTVRIGRTLMTLDA